MITFTPAPNKRKSSSKKRAPSKRKAAGYSKRSSSRSKSARYASDKPHKGWVKLDGEWVKVGRTASPKSRAPSSRKRAASKRKGAVTWPKKPKTAKGKRHLSHIVQAVSDKIFDDVEKATKILEGTKYRAKATAKKGGEFPAAHQRIIDSVVKSLRKMLVKY